MTIIAGVDVTDYKIEGCDIFYKKSAAKFWSRLATAMSQHEAHIILNALNARPEKQ